MGTLGTPGPGGAAEIQGTQEALHFLSVTGTLQQGGYREETASSAPDFTQKGMEGWRCTSQGRANVCPGPTTTTHQQSFLHQPSCQPPCSSASCHHLVSTGLSLMLHVDAWARKTLFPAGLVSKSWGWEEVGLDDRSVEVEGGQANARCVCHSTGICSCTLATLTLQEMPSRQPACPPPIARGWQQSISPPSFPA